MSGFEVKEEVQFVGLGDEDQFEKTKARQAALSALGKIKKIHKGDTVIVVHVKRHAETGSRYKYSVRARVTGPGGFFEAKETDWNFLTTAQSALLTLVREVKKEHEKQVNKKP